MAWVVKLQGPDGAVSVLGVHASYSAARRQSEDFNRRYQFDRAFVEAGDPGAAFESPRPDPR